MHFSEFLSDYSIVTLLLLALFSFTAGFIDSIVGGGGLIQLPALLISMPQHSLVTVLGTNKTGSFFGTSVAALHYARRIKFDFVLLITISFFAFVFSYLGAKTVSYISVGTLKPVLLILFILIAIYTYFKKDLGSYQTKQLPKLKQILYGSIIGTIVGFYDGLIGPGTGSFFVLGFVVILGFEFIAASAYSKVINCITNISALIVFISQDNYILEMAILLAVCNMSGNAIGTRVALKRGNGFVRIMFLLIVCGMIVRFGYDVFFD